MGIKELSVSRVCEIIQGLNEMGGADDLKEYIEVLTAMEAVVKRELQKAIDMRRERHGGEVPSDA